VLTVLETLTVPETLTGPGHTHRAHRPQDTLTDTGPHKGALTSSRALQQMAEKGTSRAKCASTPRHSTAAAASLQGKGPT